MSFSIAAAFVAFLADVRTFQNKFTTAMCIVLGSAGILVSDPIAMLAPDWDDRALSAIYVAVFRLFGMAQLDAIRLTNPNPEWSLFAGFAVAILGHAIVAAFEQTREEESSLLLCCDLIYSAFLVVWVGSAVSRAWATFEGRIVLIGGLLVSEIGCCWVLRVVRLCWEDFRFTELPEFLQTVVPMTEGVLVFYFFRKNGNRVFRPLKGADPEEEQFELELDLTSDVDEEGATVK
jgi:hypothetical protein